MGNLLAVLEWIGLGLGMLIAAFAVTFAVVRQRILQHVQGELGQNSLLLATGARVGVYDGQTEGRQPSPSVGILMLLSNGLYFRSLTGRREVFVPGASISWIGVPEERERRRTEGRGIVVRFLNASGKQDGVAIRLLYPEQWVEAIKTHLISRG
jgi:hypothetical protein